MNDYTSSEDMKVFVAFDITDDTTSSAAMTRLSNLMEDLFGDTQSIALFSSDWGVKEVVYRIQKPVLVSKDAMNDFFKKLEQLFITASSLAPRFTQLGEDTKRSTSR